MKTKKMKPLSLYFPISRIDDEERIVEGYAFVNEVVPGEGGVRLRRSAMEAATADYVQNGTVREIHQPSAAGKPLSVEWDSKGAFLRAKIVDDQAWQKVKEGVYKGFSVGVTPTVARGKDVTSCEWWDASLIDRGKDKDAKFTVWRTDNFDPEKEVEVESLERASFAEYLEGCAPSALRDMALDYLWNALWDIQYSSEVTPEDKEASVRETCGQFTDFMVGAVATGILPSISEPDDESRAEVLPEITRAMIEAKLAEDDCAIISGELLRAQEETHAAYLQRAEDLKAAEETISTLTIERDESTTELARVQGLWDADLERVKVAEERVKELENKPARVPPVRHFSGIERTFGTEQVNPEIQALKDELAEIARSEKTSDANVTDQRMSRMSVIKTTLRSLGEAI